MRGIIKTKRIAQSSINWDDSPEAFAAFKERSSYMAGWIQGAEYILNDLAAALQEEPQIRKDIAEVEAQIKSPGKKVVR